MSRREIGPEPTSGTSTGQQMMRKWNNMDCEQLRLLLCENCENIAKRLTFDDARHVAYRLFTLDMIRQSEINELYSIGSTEDIRDLLDLVIYKNTKKIYVTFFEILQSELKLGDLLEGFGREIGPEPTSGTSTGQQMMRYWDYMDVEELRKLFLDNCTNLVDTLTLGEVRRAASLLYEQKMIFRDEPEELFSEQQTGRNAASILLTLVIKKNRRMLYVTFLNIIHDDLQRSNLLKGFGLKDSKVPKSGERSQEYEGSAERDGTARSASGVGSSPAVINEDYIYIDKTKKIGSGGSAVVYAHERQNKTVALKILLESNDWKKEQQELLREGSIQLSFKHPNVIDLYEIIHSKISGGCDMISPRHQYILVLECAEGGSLLEAVHKYHDNIPHDVRVDWATQTANGLTYLHEKHCVHRDFKPDNVLIKEVIASSSDLRNKTLKISDFGLVGENYMNTKDTSRYSEARRWMAPERQTPHGLMSKKSDVWSYGIVLYWIIYSKLPDLDQSGIPIIPHDCPLNFQRILNGIFKFNHSERPEISQVLHYLRSITLPSDGLTVAYHDNANHEAMRTPLDYRQPDAPVAMKPKGLWQLKNCSLC